MLAPIYTCGTTRIRLRGRTGWTRSKVSDGTLHLEDEKELKWRIELIFYYIYVQYVRMLKHLAKAPTKAAAREFVELFVKIEAHSQLTGFAYEVWKNRTKVPLNKLEGTVLRLQQTGERWFEYPRSSLFDSLNY